jgi:hypothetical protein
VIRDYVLKVGGEMGETYVGGRGRQPSGVTPRCKLFWPAACHFKYGII